MRGHASPLFKGGKEEKMYKFLSEDWIKAYKEEWNKNQKLREELFRQHKVLHRGERRRRYSEKRGGC
jgi:hypothetical protein